MSPVNVNLFYKQHCPNPECVLGIIPDLPNLDTCLEDKYVSSSGLSSLPGTITFKKCQKNIK